VEALNAADKSQTPLKYWTFQAGPNDETAVLWFWICFKGGWNLCAKVANRSKSENADTPAVAQPLFKAGEQGMAPRGCLQWKPLVKTAISDLIRQNRPGLEKALRLAPIARQVALVHPPEPYARIPLPIDSADDLARFRFEVEMKDKEGRTKVIQGCGSGKQVPHGGEILLSAPAADVNKYVAHPDVFQKQLVYLSESCAARSGAVQRISIAEPQ